VTDHERVNVGLVSAALLAALTVATVSPDRGASAAGCGESAYAYAGYQAASTAHGVRAAITTLAVPNVGAGHVAAWVGVGGRASEPGGTDSWLQAGIVAWEGEEPFVYAEIVRAGRREVRTLAAEVTAGRSYRLAVLEVKAKPGWWRVWVDGAVAVDAVRLPDAVRSRKPMATTESWNGGGQACNSFAFRFQGVGLAGTAGGAWRPMSVGRRFLDAGYRLRRLESNARTGASFAFEASSG